MTTVALEHLRQHVRMELRKHLERRRGRSWVAIAFRGRPGWAGTPTFEERVRFRRQDDRRDDERSFRFRALAARSLLELRSHLIGLDPAADERVVIVADLPQGQFPADIRSRLLHADLCEIDPWRVLMAEFQAARVDARVRADQELALALLQHRPAGGFPAATTGVLERAMLWGCVCTAVLGLPKEEPTARDLLLWSLDEPATARLRAVPASVQTAVRDWLAERSPLTALLLGVVVTAPPADLIPLGIVLGVVHHEEAMAQPDLLRAQGRLEQITGRQAVGVKDAREWSADAAAALEQLDDGLQRRLRKRADALLGAVGAEAFAYLSDLAPLGYEQRLRSLAQALRTHLAGGSDERDLVAAAAAVRAHWDGRADSHRRMRVEMAVRLTRWLRSPAEAPATLPEAMAQYRDTLAFADWARHALVGGDPVAELQQAYAEIHEHALARRETFNRAFAELVAVWNRAPDRHGDILRIEDVGRRIVADIAADRKVLVLIMDGMSWAVAQELLPHLERHYWTLRQRTIDGVVMPAPVMSTVPSVTEFARTSLCCGRLVRGDADDERRGFAEHHELRSVSSASNPPLLFHRRDLEEAGRQGLSVHVASAIANAKQRIVGVVVNAVDDHLLKDDGGWRSWDVESIRVLADLLAAAAAAKRAIVLCSDHGHVLDHWVAGAGGAGDGGGERWHSGAPRDAETLVAGPRVAAYGAGVTAPWSERLRYGGKKNGYHGGISPQELIAPCLVLAPADEVVDGWADVHLAQPGWWRLEAESSVADTGAAAVAVARAAEVPKQRPKGEVAGQQRLFDEPEVAPAQSTAVHWPQRLLASPVYQLAAAQAGRRADDRLVLALLGALDAAPGCQLSARALAQALNVPAVRVAGIVAQVARLLNVEGYRILSPTDDREHVRLDRQLALTQFELGSVP